MIEKSVLIVGTNSFVGNNIKKTINDLNFIEVSLFEKQPDEINFNGVDSVIHLAALVHQMKGAPENEYYKINRDLAFEVAKKAKESGAKQFVFMSTVKVYGEQTQLQQSFNENSECVPIDPYGKSKLEAENLLKSIEDKNFKVAIIRSPLVYGAGVKANMYNLIKLIDRFPVLPLGGIKNSRSMVYIGNLVSLISTIIKKNESGIFIAGDREPISTTNLARFMAKGLKKKRFFFTFPTWVILVLKIIKPDFVIRIFGSLVVDNEKTNKKLSFTPPFTTEYGVIEMVNWYLNKI